LIDQDSNSVSTALPSCASRARQKLVIVTEIIAPYRIPVFNSLAKQKELDLHVIFLSENDPTLRQWRVYKEEIEFRYEVLPSWRQRFGNYNVLINHGIVAALNRIAPDAILCGGYNYLASWQAAYWAKGKRVPLLLWSESTESDQRKRHRLVEFLKAHYLHLCRAFIVPGTASFAYLSKLGISSDRIFTAPNAVDTDRFSSLAQEARANDSQLRTQLGLPARYFLYVGRLVAAKGVFDLLEAYSQLNPAMRSQVGLVFAGDGADRVNLMQPASRIKPGRICFPGFLQRDSLTQFYALSEVLIFPTHSDPWGLVVNEAMSCSLPVIVSNVAGCAPDLVENGWNGFVIAPREPSQLAAAMLCLANDSSLQKQMGTRSRQRIENYSADAWSEGIMRAVRMVGATRT
jgi:1,2-diacylglycerol 3-alpha-glucosyltransferase